MMSSRFDYGSTSKTLNLSLLLFNEQSESENLACHTISWEVITKPKEVGGFGIVTTRHRNLALLMKSLAFMDKSRLSKSQTP